jgi:hypothetical protein
MGAAFRQRRLSRGWTPIQMIGRLKIEAARADIRLPRTWLLLRLVFLWENQRIQLPASYAGLLQQVFTHDTAAKA